MTNSILDQFVSLGEEATYGTQAAAFRGYESTGDGFSRDVDFLVGEGKRAGRVGQLATRRRKVDKGASGAIESTVLTKGEGLRLKHLLGASTDPTLVGATTEVYEQTFTADARGPRGSYSAQVMRVSADGSPRPFTYLGCMAKGFSLSVETGGILMLSVDYDAQSEETSPAQIVPAYPSDADMFVYEDCKVSIGGAQVSSFNSISIEGDLMLDTERYFLQQSADKEMPLREGVPQFTGTLSGEFRDMAEFNRFVAGDPFEIVFEAIGADIIETVSSVNYHPHFKVTMPACQYDGNSPEGTLDGISTIELPFTALSTEANSILEISYQSSDSDA